MKVVKVQPNQDGYARKDNEFWHQIWNKVRGGWAPPRRKESDRRMGCRSVLLPGGPKLRLIPLWRIGVKRYTCTALIFSPQARAYFKLKDWCNGQTAWDWAESQVAMEFDDILGRVKDIVS